MPKIVFNKTITGVVFIVAGVILVVFGFLFLR